MLLLSFASSALWSASLLPAARAFAPPAAAAARRPSGVVPHRALRSSREGEGPEGEQRPHVVVLGGGFGGINTALTLPTLPWSDGAAPRVTLIDRSERFVFLPLLYELCVEDAGLDEVAPTFASLLGGAGGGEGGFASLLGGLPDLSGAFQRFAGERETGDGDRCEVSFLRAQVEGIDVVNQQVVVSKSDSIDTIDYDALVVATGAEISLDAIPGAAEYALPFYTVEQALELKRRLALLDAYIEDDAEEQTTNVVVVGGGYSGVELASNLVDRLGGRDSGVQVSLVHRGEQVLEYATEHNRNAGLERLASAGVKVMTSTSVVEVLPGEDEEDENTISTLKKQKCVLKLSTNSNDATNGEETLMPTTLLLWTAGATPTSRGNAGIRNSILPRDAMGRILTSPTLNARQHPNVFAVGDCGRPKKVPYPGTAQVAIQQATVAAWNVYATLTYGTDASSHRRTGVETESKLLPFKFLNLGEMMTLGSDDATISTLGGKVELSGPAASWLRRWIYAVRMPTVRQGLRAAVDGTGRKLARSRVGGGGEQRRRSKPVDWR